MARLVESSTTPHVRPGVTPRGPVREGGLEQSWRSSAKSQRLGDPPPSGQPPELHERLDDTTLRIGQGLLRNAHFATSAVTTTRAGVRVQSLRRLSGGSAFEFGADGLGEGFGERLVNVE